MNESSSDELAAMVADKDIAALQKIGGTDGLLERLNVNVDMGIIPASSSIDSVSDAAEPLKLTKTKSKNAELAKELAEEQDDSELTWLAEFETDRKLYADRVEKYGVNILPPTQARSFLGLVWDALHDKMLILLVVAAIVSLAIGIYQDVRVTGDKIEDSQDVHWVEGFAIIVAIAVVTLVASINDYQKEKQFRRLNAKKNDRKVRLTRGGQECLVSTNCILVGDILHIEPGDIMCADGIVVSSSNLRCDESSVTGESDAMKKSRLEDAEKATADRKSWRQRRRAELRSKRNEQRANAYRQKGRTGDIDDPFLISGSRVLEGVGRCVVVAVGEKSFYGRTLMSLRSKSEPTPLQLKLNGLAELIAKLGGAAGLLMFVVLIIKYIVQVTKPTANRDATAIVDSVVRIVISAVTVVVVAVPEGLPLAVTLALAVATTRMLKDGCLVRVLAACETMGNATTICSDKTGTLTCNRMTVVAGCIGDQYQFSSYPPGTDNDEVVVATAELGEEAPLAVLNLCHDAIAVNSTAFIPAADLQFTGSKTETAMLTWSETLGAPLYSQLRDKDIDKHVQIWPFSSERKAMSTLVRIRRREDNKLVWRLYVKGAPEVVIQDCRWIVDVDGAFQKQDNAEGIDANLNEFSANSPTGRTVSDYASRALRTIGMAYRDFETFDEANLAQLESDVEWRESAGLVCLGIFAIEDPLREGVTDAVRRCQNAGIIVRMVTGDNVLTARAIATQCGIFTPGMGGIVLEGPKFRKLTPEQMEFIIPRLQVLARSSPEDKRMLVEWLRTHGEVVSVTGDGTNDGPALKAANVGFSMGIAGTEVAKEASSIVVMDDDFKSIVRACMWGRAVNDAVKKFLQFQITVNVTAVLIAFVSSVADDEEKSVFTAVQLLWINLIMDTFAALALATDPPSESLLDRHPEKQGSPLITFTMWKNIIGQSILQVVVCFLTLYAADDIFNLHTVQSAQDMLVLRTLVFNTFAWMQIFNEFNCRVLHNEVNCFKGMQKNWFFLGIVFISVIGQVIIIQWGGVAFQTTALGGKYWAFSIIAGFLSLPVGLVLRLIPDELIWWMIPF
ncbi:PMCA-type calcium-translocating P-type ATPase, partial [Kickxella alabastrina]|uniref:PMCA-type calcium-translocating P-type ATPase n=1 Tax=Kickxella alabastrina TaxID=61397 RepID=UPI00221EAD5D